MSDWSVLPLREVAVLIKRGRAPRYSENGAIVVNQKCIQPGNRFSTFLARRTDTSVKSVPDWAWLQEIDSVVNSTGRGTLGRAAFVGRLEEPATADSHVAIVRPDVQRVVPEFLGLVLSSQPEAIERLQSGSTSQTELSPTALGTLPIALPPLAVQRRIVDLLAHLDNHLANLQTERDAATQLGVSLRRQLFGSLSAPTAPASDIFDMMLGRQKSAKQSIGSHVIPYIRAANISESGLRLSDVQSMNFEPHEQDRYGLKPGDILLVEGGSIGLAARWMGELEGPVGFDKHVIRLRQRAGVSTSDYALQWAHHSRETGAFDAQATGITIRALGFGRASLMPVPKISISEQERICQPLSAIDSSISALDAEIAKLRLVRGNLVSGLLNGERSIPVTYDARLDEVA